MFTFGSDSQQWPASSSISAGQKLTYLCRHRRLPQADLAYRDIHCSHSLYYQLQRSSAIDTTARDIDIVRGENHTAAARQVPALPAGR
jgi:hypothetical protein